MTKWTAPDIASIRGDNSRPLQKIFGSLTEYLRSSAVGRTEVVQTFVRNAEATTLTVGTVVYLHEQQGDRATVKRAFNTTDATSAKTLGVVAEAIAPNADGLVTTSGYVEKVDTSGFTAGQTVYLSATAGLFTATKPYAPNHLVYVGVVVRANAGNGILYVRCQNGYELDEIHDVLITSPVTGDILVRNDSSLWVNAPQTSIYMPVGSVISYSGSTAPAGYLLCDGTAVSRTTYASLFSVINTTYGVGNGTTTFNLPNLKGKVPVGRDSLDTSFDVLGEVGGAKTHILSPAEMPVHTHTQNTHNHTQNTHNHTQNAHTHTQDAHNHGGSVGTGEFVYRDNTYSTGFNSWVGNVYLALTWNSGTANKTATNQSTIPTNVGTIATNVSTIATNQNAGGTAGVTQAHNNLQPYIVLNYIVKV